MQQTFLLSILSRFVKHLRLEVHIHLKNIRRIFDNHKKEEEEEENRSVFDHRKIPTKISVGRESISRLARNEKKKEKRKKIADEHLSEEALVAPDTVPRG